MHLIDTKKRMIRKNQLAKKDSRPRILVVGPLPPPINGTGVSFQLFCNEVQNHTETHHLEVIDSSPKYLKEESRITSLANYRQSLGIFKQYFKKVPYVDQVLLFGSNGFVLLMVPILLVIAKIFHKPCYVRVFGGSSDNFIDDLRPVLRRSLLLSLQLADGLIVQTKWLYDRLTVFIGDGVYLVPGYRSMLPIENTPPFLSSKAGEDLRLAFVGIVKEEKGVFILLDSLRRLNSNGNPNVRCDFYGMISESSAARFRDELAKTKNATYGGVLDPEMVIPTLRDYDALVLPTFYDGEGHPGVLIEAMMAGIPVVTTNFRSIPELVEDRVNGLLVAPENAKSLASAIKTIDEDRQLLAELGRRNWERRMRYDARQVVPFILQPLGINLQAASAAHAEAY